MESWRGSSSLLTRLESRVVDSVVTLKEKSFWGLHCANDHIAYLPSAEKVPVFVYCPNVRILHFDRKGLPKWQSYRNIAK